MGDIAKQTELLELEQQKMMASLRSGKGIKSKYGQQPKKIEKCLIDLKEINDDLS